MRLIELNAFERHVDAVEAAKGGAPPDELQDFVSILRWRAAHQGEGVAFRFLKNGVDEDSVMNYANLDEQARLLAGRLQHMGLTGQRVLLLYPSCPFFLIAMLGCLYAGVVPVPLIPPRPNRTASRLMAAAKDAHPHAALTTAAVCSVMGNAIDELVHETGLHVLATDTTPSSPTKAYEWRPPAFLPSDLAYLQYTSGSTSAPKGVMVTHGNLLDNCRTIAEVVGDDAHHTVISWLPFFHDMGLIGGLFTPLFLGCPLIAMPPEAFVMKPIRWLRAISRYGATLSPAPNFAYDMCVEGTTLQDRDGLDLSRWRVAFNGSERIDPGSLRRFTNAFARYGFRPETFYPCYGLAESTLLVTGGSVAEPPVVKRFGQCELNSGTARPVDGGVELVGCGKTSSRQQLLIVDQTTGQKCPPGRIGEIWVSGPSVAAGYWNNPELTASTFQARDAENSVSPFLRTGDLGFRLDGELFVTGRLKDLIIIGGRNIYPEDIEATVEQGHPLISPQGAVAFAFDDGPLERLVVVAEIDRSGKCDQRASDDRSESNADIRRDLAEAVARQHDVPLYKAVLVKRRTLPKTPNGKKMRSACRQAYIERRLQIDLQ